MPIEDSCLFFIFFFSRRTEKKSWKMRLSHSIYFIASLAQCVVSTTSPIGDLHQRDLLGLGLDNILSQPDLAKRFDVGTWASACFGFDMDRFTDILDIGNFFSLIVPLMSTPCFPTASTLMTCAFQNGLKGLTDGGLFHPPDIVQVRGCLCQNADFMGELAKYVIPFFFFFTFDFHNHEVLTVRGRCYNCARDNGASLLPDLSLFPGAGQAAHFCGNNGGGGGGLGDGSSTALQNSTNVSQILQRETVSSAPTASNAVISTGAPTSAPGLDGSGGDGGSDGSSLPAQASSAPDHVSAASGMSRSLSLVVSTLMGVMVVSVLVL